MNDERQEFHSKRESARALVPIENGPGPGPRSAAIRPLATFIAQVVACQTRLGEFRRYRRAQAPEATAVYGSARAVRRPEHFQRLL